MALIDKLNSIGSAIREKNGTTDLIPLADMPQAILDIVSGGGKTYTSIIFEEDDKITLTEKNGIEHIIEYEYTDDKITSIKYDGKAVELTYDGDVLVKVGKTVVGTRVWDYSIQVNSVYKKIFSDYEGTAFETAEELRESYPELIVFYNATTSTVDCLTPYTNGTQSIGMFNYSDEFVPTMGVFRIKNVTADGKGLKNILDSIINSEEKFVYYSSGVYISGYSKMFINCGSSRINNINLKPSDLEIIEF